jgi:hypothetical protein
MGDDEVRIPDAPRPRGRRAERAASSRPVPLANVLLCLVVVVLGVVMAVQGGSGGRARLAAPVPAGTPTSQVEPVHPLVAVADAILLRGAFSVVPALQQPDPADVPQEAGPPASVSAPLLGASGLRPAGLVLRTPGASERATGTGGVLWAAYELAARRVSARCHLQTSLLAAIGEVESGSLAGRGLDARHDVVPPVLGPVLSGGRVAAIRDTDGGLWDGNRMWDRAVGPMQFIPGTWRAWGSDGNGDGVADPQNVEDAAYSAARYLCAGGRDLSDIGDLRAAILSYNRSLSYLARVLELMGTIEPGSLPGLPILASTAPRSPAAAPPAAKPASSLSTPPASTSATPPATSTASPATSAPPASTTPAQTSMSPSPASTPLALTSTGTGTGTVPPPTSTGTATSAAAPDPPSSP